MGSTIKKDGIHLGYRLPGDAYHVVPQLGSGLVEAGGIHKDKLSSPRFTMPQMRFRVVWGLWDTMATFSPHQPVGQGGFSHIGAACNGDHCGFACHSGSPFCQIKLIAARILGPVLVAGTKPDQVSTHGLVKPAGAHILGLAVTIKRSCPLPSRQAEATWRIMARPIPLR